MALLSSSQGCQVTSCRHTVPSSAADLCAASATRRASRPSLPLTVGDADCLKRRHHPRQGDIASPDEPEAERHPPHSGSVAWLNSNLVHLTDPAVRPPMKYRPSPM